MAKKVVFEVEDYTKVLSFVSDQKLSTPGAIEAFKILNEAILMDITITEEAKEIPLIEPLPELTEQDIINSFAPEE